jgi:hypothetical protein
MTMTPRVTKLALTAHVASSVGWLGAVVVFLGLALVAMTSRDFQTVRAAYVAMESTTWWVLVPFAFASLLTGLVQSLGTKWGLFRHYWILAKLVINVFANIILLMYTQTLDYLANVAAAPSFSNADLALLRGPTVLLHTCLALMLLLVATMLSIYKPRGMTRYGQRKTDEKRGKHDEQRRQRHDPTSAVEGNLTI